MVQLLPLIGPAFVGIMTVLYLFTLYLSWSIFIADKLYMQLYKHTDLLNLDERQEKIGRLIRKRTMLYLMVPVIILWFVLWVRDPVIAYSWIDPDIIVDQSGLFVYFSVTILIFVFMEHIYYKYCN
jgi:hypothetical protein